MLLYQVNARHVTRNVPNTISIEQALMCVCRGQRKLRSRRGWYPRHRVGCHRGKQGWGFPGGCFPDDREVWDVTHVREEYVETTEGEGVDFLGELLELSGWTLVDDDETESELP
jgi:hypothetical protein